ncbi:hypothetical protein [Streptomyces sp. NPDC048225]|uniref:hypothetical protein n=1 Tax=Streptomyces sp. NPDC048225 TaxID=3365518 RepID=UPI0037242B13
MPDQDRPPKPGRHSDHADAPTPMPAAAPTTTGASAANLRCSAPTPSSARAQAVIGAREARDGDLVGVRLRDGRHPGRLSGTELLRRIADRVGARGPELWESA